MSLFLVSACNLPFLKAKLEPFEKGILVGGTYYNDQAKIKFSVPIGWDAKVEKGAQKAAEDTLDDAGIDTANYSSSAMDFLCKNPNTGSNLSVSFAPMNNGKSFDKNVDEVIDYVIKEGENMGIDYAYNDEFDETIAGREWRVVLLDMTYSGVDMKEYGCFCEIDSYMCMIIVVPNDFVNADETFEAIIANFSETDE